MLRLGYHGVNQTLRKEGILTDRTCRASTVKKMGISYLESLCESNLRDLYTILKWNVKKGIHFYRISSGICPHVTNPAFLRGKAELVYDIRKFTWWAKIGKLAVREGLRLTFHPGQYVSLSSGDPEIVSRSVRELRYHSLMCELMGLGEDSVLVIHGGGLYGDKEKASLTWIKNYQALPEEIRKRVVLENDEKSYGIADVLAISERCGVPVVLDVFHYQIYEETIVRKRRSGEDIPDQPSLEDVTPGIIASWGERRIKMHLSEQKKGGIRGAHSDYIKKIPPYLLSFPERYGRDLDLMVEAKANELALLDLLSRYSGRTTS